MTRDQANTLIDSMSVALPSLRDELQHQQTLDDEEGQTTDNVDKLQTIFGDWSDNEPDEPGMSRKARNKVLKECRAVLKALERYFDSWATADGMTILAKGKHVADETIKPE